MRTKRPLAYPRLKARMAELDVPANELADVVGIHEGSMSQIQRGRLRPSAALQHRIAEALGSTVDDLFAPVEHQAAA